MLNVTDLRAGTIYKDDQKYYRVLWYKHIKLGRGNATIRVKVCDIKSGSIIEKTFVSGTRVDSADLTRKNVQFLYKDDQSFHFMDQETFEQFELHKDIIGESVNFLKEGAQGVLSLIDNQPAGFDLPITLPFKIIKTGPSEKGNTASNVMKAAEIETGATVKVPMFIQPGDTIKVDTTTGQYIARV